MQTVGISGRVAMALALSRSAVGNMGREALRLASNLPVWATPNNPGGRYARAVRRWQRAGRYPYASTRQTARHSRNALRVELRQDIGACDEVLKHAHRLPDVNVETVGAAMDQLQARLIYISGPGSLQRYIDGRARLHAPISAAVTINPQTEPAPMPTRMFPDIASSSADNLVGVPVHAKIEPPDTTMQQSKVYSVKSNAARAAAKYGLTRDDLLQVEGGWIFGIAAPHA